MVDNMEINNRKDDISKILALSPLPHFDWDKAKYFYYITKLKSFSHAAQFLNISQSALSRKIKNLEDNLNCKLFNRHARGVELTRKGEQLFEIVEYTFIKLRGFNFDPISMNISGEKRNIKILATHAMAVYVLKKHILDYNENNPNITFQIITDDHLIDIYLQDVDIAIRPYDKITKGIIQEPFFKFEKKIFASQRYLDKFGEPKKIEKLKEHHIIIPARTKTYPYSELEWIAHLGLSPGERHIPVFESTSIEYSVGAAIKGLGILAGYEEMSIIKDSGLIRILKDIKGPIDEDFIIYPEYLKNDQCLIDFKKYLVKNCFS